MKTQKIVILRNNFDSEYSKKAKKIWYIIDSESNGVYSENTPVIFIT